jgi:hypothetical protein
MVKYKTAPAGKQRRFEGMDAIVPDIDWRGAYDVRALLDTLHVRVVLDEPTQRRRLLKIVGAVSPGASARALERPESCRAWVLTLQDPHAAMLDDVLAAVRERYTVESWGELERLDVALDFKPRTPEGFGVALDVLGATFMPTDEYRRGEDNGRGHVLNAPRIYDASARGDLIPLAHLQTMREPGRRFHDGLTRYWGAKKPPTLERSAKEDRTYWKLYWKVKDRKNALPPEAWRVRFEVSLNDKELRALGLSDVSDLPRFNFARLVRRHFHFVLPTAHAGMSGAMVELLWLSSVSRWQCILREQRSRLEYGAPTYGELKGVVTDRLKRLRFR